ncbi:hypothetical protein AAGQ96_01800 [Pantoea sp. MBD-2R]|uniref:hypothetical protein n=1 Tax=unclassified Pantoea TaxID=2630326 RepID=UPI0011BFDAD9|nr:hypothetical protein [Pantoea sp. CCBC3-3-1]
MPSSAKGTVYNEVMARQRLVMQVASQVIVKQKIATGEIEIVDGRLVAGKNFKDAKTPVRSGRRALLKAR